MSVFFSIFEKVKKDIFARNFLKMCPVDLKMCAKKTCNRSGSSPKILSKSDNFSKIYDIFDLYHFLIPSTVVLLSENMRSDLSKSESNVPRSALVISKAYTIQKVS